MPMSADPNPGSLPSRQMWSKNNQALYASHSLARSSTSIRVLDLDTDSHSNAHSELQDVISGSLRVVDLNDAPDFRAISYVWGDYSTPVKDVIICNGYPIEVTKSCWSALWHLRKIHGAITIWIDAICINQADDEEKKGQIPLMGNIYRSAQPVYIWLGEGTNDTDRAMDYLAKGGLPFDFLIARRVGGPGSGGAIPTGNGMALRFAIHIFARMLTFQLRPHYVALDTILSHPWIKRIWTLQEALLSDNAVIVCGGKSISWIPMVYAIDYIDFWRCTDTGPQFPPSFHDWRRLMLLWRNLPSDNVQQGGNHLFVDKKALEAQLAEHRRYLKRGSICHEFVYDYGLLAMVWILMVLQSLQYIAPGWTPKSVAHVMNWSIVLLAGIRCMMHFFTMSHFTTAKRFHSVLPLKESESIMMEIQSRKSFKTEDKYYGTVGIIGTPQTMRLLEVSNLQESLGGIYRALFVDILMYTKSLDILLFTSSSKLDSCPSWIVDWRSDEQPWFKAMYWYDKREPSFLNSLEDTTGLRKYSGAAPSLSLYCQIQWPDQLSVHGIDVGRLDWISETFNKISMASPYDQFLQSVAAFQIAWSGFPLDNIESTMRDIGRFVGTCVGEPENESHREEWVKTMQEVGNEIALDTLVSHTTRRASWFRSVRPDPWKYHLWLTSFFALANMVLVRCSGIHTGFGVAPMGAREDDIVALILGVSMPMILRQDGESYKVIGPAFLSGTLDGQLRIGSRLEALVQMILI